MVEHVAKWPVRLVAGALLAASCTSCATLSGLAGSHPTPSESISVATTSPTTGASARPSSAKAVATTACRALPAQQVARQFHAHGVVTGREKKTKKALNQVTLRCDYTEHGLQVGTLAVIYSKDGAKDLDFALRTAHYGGRDVQAVRGIGKGAYFYGEKQKNLWALTTGKPHGADSIQLILEIRTNASGVKPALTTLSRYALARVS
jgi:hypothetical protein